MAAGPVFHGWKTVGRHILVGTNRWTGRWGQTAAVHAASGHPKGAGNPTLTPLKAQARCSLCHTVYLCFAMFVD